MKCVAVLVGLLCSLSVSAASFNCKKASTYVETTICQNTVLSQLDVEMANMYLRKLGKAMVEGNWSVSHQTSLQREWLHYQRNTCQTQACIIDAYESYLGHKKTQKIVSNLPLKDAFGVFKMPIDISVYQGEYQGWQKSKANDFLSITSVPQHANSKDFNNSLESDASAIINADLIFTNAHTCTLHNEPAKWYGNHFRLIKKEGDISCELRLYPTKHDIYLRDINHQCRKLFCGARGSFDRFVIDRLKSR